MFCYLFQSRVPRGRVNHEAVNLLVRQYRGQLAAPLQANLRRLRTEVEGALDGEDNVTVFIYISDVLPRPICFQMGKGENELVIDIEEDGIYYAWTKKTFWKSTRDFFSDVAHNIVEGLSSVLTSVLSIGGHAMRALTYE